MTAIELGVTDTINMDCFAVCNELILNPGVLILF